MKFQLEVSHEQVKDVTHLQAVLNLKTMDDVVAQAIQVLKWVVRQTQKNMSVVAVHEEGHLSQRLEMPMLERIAVDVEAIPASQFPHLVAEHVRKLVEHGFIEEAKDAAEVAKRFKEATHHSQAKPAGESADEMERVDSAMKLEAAKIMAEEGAPATAMQLVKDVGVTEKKSTQKGKKGRKDNERMKGKRI